MKKFSFFLTIVLIISSIISSVNCESSSIVNSDSLSSLSDEELFLLESLIEAEKENRGFLTQIYDGKYWVGKDIPAGYYLIHYVKYVEEERNNSSLHISIYTYSEDGRTIDTFMKNGSKHGTTKICLEEGQLFEITMYSNAVAFIEKTSASLFDDE